MSSYTASCTVFENVEIDIQFSICGAEHDVGIMSEYIEEWFVTYINGVKITNPQTIEKFCERVEANPKEFEIVEDAMYSIASRDFEEPDNYDWN